MTRLEELIERLEKAPGEDRTLDFCVMLMSHGDDPDEYRVDGQFAHLIPRYTASLDSAITLVPEGFSHGHKTLPNWKTKAEVGTHEAMGSTPAIALCIAALKALQSLQSEGRE